MLADIEARIEADFALAERDEARAILRQLIDDLGDDGSSIIERCVLFLARGNIERLHLWADESRKDWRDVIIAAELGDGARNYRDFNKPFPEFGLSKSET